MKIRINPRVLVAVVVGCVLIALSISYFHSRIRSRAHAQTVMRNASQIYTGLIAWAQDNSGDFPTDTPAAPWKYSDEAFQVLFEKGIVDDANIFEETGNPLYPGTPGVIAWGYVKGLNTTSSPSDTPLLMSRGLLGNPGHWGHDPTKPGGAGPRGEVIIAYVSGSAKVAPTNSATPRCVEKIVGGKPVDQFSLAGGVDPADCLNPK